MLRKGVVLVGWGKKYEISPLYSEQAHFKTCELLISRTFYLIFSWGERR
jgi:hypothetical protein